jgi:hypothetical protein
MSWRIQALLTIAGFLLTAPVTAQAAGHTSAFDGTYAGVSMDVSKTNRESTHCPQGGTPQPLTITHGVVKPSSGKGWTGTVSPQGSLVIRNQYAMHVHAQIDPQGTVTGEYHGPQCVVKYMWRKQPS